MVNKIYVEDSVLTAIVGDAQKVLVGNYYFDNSLENKLLKKYNNLIHYRDYLDFLEVDDFISSIKRYEAISLEEILGVMNNNITSDHMSLLNAYNELISKFILIESFLRESDEITALNHNDPTYLTGALEEHAREMLSLISSTTLNNVTLKNSVPLTNNLMFYYDNYLEYLNNIISGKIEFIKERLGTTNSINITKREYSTTEAELDMLYNIVSNSEEKMIAYYLDKVDFIEGKNPGLIVRINTILNFKIGS